MEKNIAVETADALSTDNIRLSVADTTSFSSTCVSKYVNGSD